MSWEIFYHKVLSREIGDINTLCQIWGDIYFVIYNRWWGESLLSGKTDDDWRVTTRKCSQLWNWNRHGNKECYCNRLRVAFHYIFKPYKGESKELAPTNLDFFFLQLVLSTNRLIYHFLSRLQVKISKYEEIYFSFDNGSSYYPKCFNSKWPLCWP